MINYLIKIYYNVVGIINSGVFRVLKVLKMKYSNNYLQLIISIKPIFVIIFQYKNPAFFGVFWVLNLRTRKTPDIFIKNFMLTNFEWFFLYLKHLRVKWTFCKHLPPGFHFWTFLKCPISKSWPIYFPRFFRFFEWHWKIKKLENIIYFKVVMYLLLIFIL